MLDFFKFFLYLKYTFFYKKILSENYPLYFHFVTSGFCFPDSLFSVLPPLYFFRTTPPVSFS